MLVFSAGDGSEGTTKADTEFIFCVRCFLRRLIPGSMDEPALLLLHVSLVLSTVLLNACLEMHHEQEKSARAAAAKVSVKISNSL